MLFFSRCVVVLVPAKGKISKYFRTLFGYWDCREEVVAWHRTELRRLDPEFRSLQIALRLSAAYDEAEQEGISPLSLEYPDTRNFWHAEKRFYDDLLKENPETSRAKWDERMQRLADTVTEMNKKSN